MKRLRSASGIVVLCLGSSACAPSTGASEVRSPSHDYPPPPRTTADGEVIGADRRPAVDTIDGTREPPKKREPAKPE